MANFAIYFADFGDTGASVYISINSVIKLPTSKFPNEETAAHTHMHTHYYTTVSLHFTDLNTF